MRTITSFWRHHMELDQLRDYPVNGVYVISHGMFAQSVCVCVCGGGGGGGGGGRGVQSIMTGLSYLFFILFTFSFLFSSSLSSSL